jgi:hypothetical protein
MENDLCNQASCPICGEGVFFVRHNGGSVWFDSLGQPWPKHGCFDNPPLKVADDDLQYLSTSSIKYQYSINTTQDISRKVQEQSLIGRIKLGVIAEAKLYSKTHIRLTIDLAFGRTRYGFAKTKVKAKEITGAIVLLVSEEKKLHFLTQDFVLDLLDALPDEKRLKKLDSEDVSFSVGDAVRHPMFGNGKVSSIQESGDDLKLGIIFGFTHKTVLAKIAGIEKISSKS